MTETIPVPFPTSRVLVVSDFNCPYCYTLNEWIHRIGASSRVRWVGVEHRPDLSALEGNSDHDRDTLSREVSDVQHRAPDVGVVRPMTWHNSRSALLVQNAVEDEYPEAAPALRLSIFRAYWRDRAPLDDAVIQSCMEQLDLFNVEREPEYLDELSEWWRTELDRIPCMIAPTGVAHLGLQDFRSVKAFLNSALRAGSVGPGCR
jgi:hypothetical protein